MGYHAFMHHSAFLKKFLLDNKKNFSKLIVNCNIIELFHAAQSLKIKLGAKYFYWATFVLSNLLI